MLAGVIQFIYFKKFLGSAGLEPISMEEKKRSFYKNITLSVSLIVSIPEKKGTDLKILNVENSKNLKIGSDSAYHFKTLKSFKLLSQKWQITLRG